MTEPIRRKRVLIGVARWAYAQPEAEAWRIEVAAHLGKMMADPAFPYDFDFVTTPNMLVHFAREQICQRAVAGGYDFVAMVDDDMNGPVDLWEKLLAHDVDVVSPLAFTRLGNHLPVVYGMVHRFVTGQGFVPVKTHFIMNYPRNTLFECDAVGFGAVLIKTDLLKRMPQPWFFTFKDDGTGGTGEDIWFCRKAVDKGNGRIFCDSTQKLGHLGGAKWITEDDYLTRNPKVTELYDVAGEWSKDKSKEGLLT